MKIKPTSTQSLWVILLVFLAACGKQPVFLPIENSTPMAISPTPSPTATWVPPTAGPTPLPTEPIVHLIPVDAIMVERWMDYEDALANAFFSSFLTPDEVVCEWIILGRADLEVYVWSHCAGIYSATPSQGSIPAVIHLGADGSVHSAEIPGSGSLYGPDINRLFPKDVQDKIFGDLRFPQEMGDRMRWRRGHPDEPPWIISSFLQIQPTQAVLPFLKPDATQVERWMEYQTALAKVFSYLPPDQIICEWELLGRSGNEVYVWAVCGEIHGYRIGLEGLARINLGDNGAVLDATTEGVSFPSEIRQSAPLAVQERYFSGSIHFQELVDHLRWRQAYPEEPPLIVLSAKP